MRFMSIATQEEDEMIFIFILDGSRYYIFILDGSRYYSLGIIGDITIVLDLVLVIARRGVLVSHLNPVLLLSLGDDRDSLAWSIQSKHNLLDQFQEPSVPVQIALLAGRLKNLNLTITFTNWVYNLNSIRLRNCKCGMIRTKKYQYDCYAPEAILVLGFLKLAIVELGII
jgi:hypothetical protein